MVQIGGARDTNLDLKVEHFQTCNSNSPLGDAVSAKATSMHFPRGNFEFVIVTLISHILSQTVFFFHQIDGGSL